MVLNVGGMKKECTRKCYQNDEVEKERQLRTDVTDSEHDGKRSFDRGLDVLGK